MARLYVGKLPENVTKDEIDATFKLYGDIKDIWLARNPPGFAFVEYGDKVSADKAVSALSGQQVLGTTLRVEAASSKPRPSGDRAPAPRGRRSPPYSRGRYHDRYSAGPSYGGYGPPPSNYYYDYPYAGRPMRQYDRYYGGRDYYGGAGGGGGGNDGYERRYEPPPPPPHAPRPGPYHHVDAHPGHMSANSTPIGQSHMPPVNYAPPGTQQTPSLMGEVPLNPPGVPLSAPLINTPPQPPGVGRGPPSLMPQLGQPGERPRGDEMGYRPPEGLPLAYQPQ
eukprot:m.4457 g.4457  ORF g.4457 m.4457 type:complete len:280 (+) comp10766_c0_seq2:184-1023(+)